MEKLIKKYTDKLVDQGICSQGEPLFGFLDAEIGWNRESEKRAELEKVLNGLNINSILFSKPAEPYYTLINYLAKYSTGEDGAIHPQDTETRTFLHDIPVAEEFTGGLLISHLKRRKAVIVRDQGIVTFGVVSPEQAFIVFSSVCFSCFVKLLTDYSYHKKNMSPLPDEYTGAVKAACEFYEKLLASIEVDFPITKGPFGEDHEIIKAMAQAGKLLIDSGMVDSFFGNISYRRDETIFISQTGSSMDELGGFIDICPIDNSTSNAITASSEFSAHKSVYELTDVKAILHGHPKLSAVISMICDNTGCTHKDICHTGCPEERFMDDIPIVPGEVGTGPTGLHRTLPPAMKGRGVIVYGHGLFTVGKIDFRDAFQNLIDIEKRCFRLYMDRVF
jgi:ribulose-5-phosphate 4-epimerase/fuculose-1-phosphate aldolase